MSDDTTTWLKKNPANNPLRRSLKTSLRFHVNGSEMDASIMSNTGKPKDQPIQIPRMLQRPSMRMRFQVPNEFKVPAKVTPRKRLNSVTKSKPLTETNSNSRSIEARKSLLPVINKSQTAEKRGSSLCDIVRTSYQIRSSARKNNLRRNFIQQMMEACQNNVNGGTNHLKTNTAGDGSVIRSILKKKRVSLRKSIQLADAKKPKAVKKVLFEGFGDLSNLDKENDSIAVSPISKQPEHDFEITEDPTVFLNFPKSKFMESSPVPVVSTAEEENLDLTNPNDTQTTTTTTTTATTNVLKAWRNYMDGMLNLQSMRTSLSDSLRAHTEQGLTLQTQLKSYMKKCDEMYEELSNLGKEMEENIIKTQEAEMDEDDGGKAWCSNAPSRNSAEKKYREKTDKIKLSEKSKAIKKSTGKTNSGLKSGLWREAQDGFALVETKGVFCKQKEF